MQTNVNIRIGETQTIQSEKNETCLQKSVWKQMNPGGTREFTNSPMLLMCPSAQSSLEFIEQAEHLTPMKSVDTDVFSLFFFGGYLGK